MKRAFTLVELLVVMAMIAVLTASLGTAVVKARTRAKIARATQEAKEITNAILAFEHYAVGRTLARYANGSWGTCSEGAMKMILGGETGESGEQVPVLYEGGVAGGSLRDPWGTAYEYRIENTGKMDSGDGSGADRVQFLSVPALPNFFRLSNGERQNEAY